MNLTITQQIAIGILLPFLGTLLGSAFVFFLKKKMKPIVQKILLGFASGVMIAASIWSLIMPAIEMSTEQGKIAWLPATVGFLVGVFGLIGIRKLIDKIEKNKEKKKEDEKIEINKNIENNKIESNEEIKENNKNNKLKEKIKSTIMLILSVTLHNIPEGMAVGVVFAGLLAKDASITFMGAIILSIGIAIQNIPEGAIISMPLHSQGMGKFKSFIYGMLSGIVEPIGAIITILMTKIVVPILPYLLSFAAGAMIYVVVEDLIPEAQEDKKSNVVAISLALGFVIMMILDVALG